MRISTRQFALVAAGTLGAGFVAADIVDDGEVSVIGAAGTVLALCAGAALAPAVLRTAQPLLDARLASPLDLVSNGRKLGTALEQDVALLHLGAAPTGAPIAGRQLTLLQHGPGELSGVTNEHARRGIATLLGSLDDLNGAGALDTIAFTSSHDGFAGIVARDGAARWASSDVRGRLTIARDVRDALRLSKDAGALGMGWYHNGVAALTPDATAGLAGALAGRTRTLTTTEAEAIITLLHEARHGSSPLQRISGLPIWLEEALATRYSEALVGTAARSIGREVPVGFTPNRAAYYESATKLLEAMARHGGHDLETSAGRALFDAALRRSTTGSSMDSAWQLLGDPIAARAGTDAARVGAMLRSFTGTDADRTRLLDLVRSARLTA